MSFGDGAQYSGGWLNDARHGFGSYRPVKQTPLCILSSRFGCEAARLPNGSCYDGDFKAVI